jgi:uncharacterized membrane protein
MNTQDGFLPVAERMLQGVMIGALALSGLMLLGGLAAFMTRSGEPRVEVMLTAGLILLMSTPAIRVCIAVLGAIRERDWLFLTSTVAVTLLLVLTMGLALARLSS